MYKDRVNNVNKLKELFGEDVFSMLSESMKVSGRVKRAKVLSSLLTEMDTVFHKKYKNTYPDNICDLLCHDKCTCDHDKIYLIMINDLSYFVTRYTSEKTDFIVHEVDGIFVDDNSCDVILQIGNKLITYDPIRKNQPLKDWYSPILNKLRFGGRK